MRDPESEALTEIERRAGVPEALAESSLSYAAALGAWILAGRPKAERPQGWAFGLSLEETEKVEQARILDLGGGDGRNGPVR